MPPETETEALRQEVARLADEVKRLNQHRFVRVHNNLARLMAFQFLRGMMLGLGTALGATALVSVVVLLLSQIEFIPILGDWATALIEEIKIDEAE
ncbi:MULTISPECIES: DUF5665 domain-containing protein [Mameliella]|uniref:Uncharacterized protein n=1 Tax=Mameliella alba TaxID=561184 RepID=A0A0B3SXL3_9RHOB|nr:MULTISPECIES: DUF5665 domain-containing protein [Mameliella]MCR9274077.1 DUF5665 domain-containing protein [Paracoccaceae bacterium]ODM48646.1 hypothetical protein A9320_02900 [Ruegeria sp. PBVC088]KHQ55159.1 hypothetical protein OA50_00195 [Mameliella alba]MBY6118876.1 hypothetical protein [Mameliella alba]MDD9731988.1 DUF5665 domain-containing protein [Mameliella sp. AT18]